MTIHDEDMDGGHVDDKNNDLTKVDSGSPCSSDASSFHSQKAEVRKSNNVSELVAKSKKAASSLWTLLHAKNCRLGVNMCSHLGCPEAKLMYLHLKTCSAVLLEPCPSQHLGCQDARKLLAHYRRCRDIRARQAQNPAARSQHHVCLVCSLVARHAKFTLDRTIATPGCRLSSVKRDGNSSHFVPSLILKEEESFDEKSNESSTVVFTQSYDETRGFMSAGPRPDSSSPRFPFSRPVTRNRDGNGRGFQALQAAVSCAIEANHPSSLSSSLDSIGDDSIGNNSVHNKSNYTRPRSESFDVQSCQYSQEAKRSDGTKSMSYLYLAAVESLEEEPPTPSRRRSQSCSVPSTNVSSTENRILGKPMGEELQCFLGGDS